MPYDRNALQQRRNPKTKMLEWCLVSLKGRALQYFGLDKPGDEVVLKAIERVEKYAKKGPV